MAKESANQSFSDKERIKCAKTLVWAGFFLYVIMMGSKNVFTAEMVSLMDVFETSKEQTSLAMTYYFITYAIAQFVLTFIMSKLDLRMFLTLSGGLSAITTILMGFAGTIEYLYVLCAFNGIFTAGIYSGCMAAFSKYLPANLLPFANKMMSIGTAVWGALSYGIPPLFVGKGLWNAPFILLGAFFLLSVIWFFHAFNKMKKFPPIISDTIVNNTTTEEEPYIKIKKKSGIIIYFIVLLGFSLLGNTIHYMVMNWIPNMLNATFNMPQSYSILITLIVPVISVFGSILSINLCQKYTNIFIVGAVLTSISLVALIPMIFAFDVNIILSIALIAIFVTLGTGGRGVFTGILAFKMRTQVNSGSYLAAFNAVAALAAGIVPPLTGKLIDSFNGVTGYGISYLVATLLSVIYIICMIIFAIYYNKTKKHP